MVGAAAQSSTHNRSDDEDGQHRDNHPTKMASSVRFQGSKARVAAVEYSHCIVGQLNRVRESSTPFSQW